MGGKIVDMSARYNALFSFREELPASFFEEVENFHPVCRAKMRLSEREKIQFSVVGSEEVKFSVPLRTAVGA